MCVLGFVRVFLRLGLCSRLFASVFVWMCVCKFVSVCVSCLRRFDCMLSFGGSFRLSVFVCLLVCLFVCLFVCFVVSCVRVFSVLFTCPCVHMCVCDCLLIVSLFVCLLVCLFVGLSECLVVCLFVCMVLCMLVCSYVVVCVRVSAGSPCVRVATPPWQVYLLAPLPPHGAAAWRCASAWLGGHAACLGAWLCVRVYVCVRVSGCPRVRKFVSVCVSLSAVRRFPHGFLVRDTLWLYVVLWWFLSFVRVCLVACWLVCLLVRLFL